MTATALAQPRRSWMTELNTTGHRTGVTVFMLIVLAHWAEHVAQAIQIWVLGWPVPESRGVLGAWFPWLVTSEALHYGYALVMLAGLVILLPGFTGTARTWWTAALVIQVWHHLEHLLLLGQSVFNSNLAGKPVPTSIVQLAVPRVELHLFYNAIVTIPMVVAVVLDRRSAPTGDQVAAAAPA
jgi:hypothetical protein